MKPLHYLLLGLGLCLAVSAFVTLWPVSTLSTATPLRTHRRTAAVPVATSDGYSTHWLAVSSEFLGGRNVVVAAVARPEASTDSFDSVVPVTLLMPDLAATVSQAPEQRRTMWCYYERGWPFPWLSCERPWFAESDWPNPLLIGGLDIGSRPTDPAWPVGVSQLRVLPYRVHATALVANTLVLGAAIWTIGFLLAKLRRMRRIRRGNCPSCGHALAGSQSCPECGARRRSA